MSAFLLSLFLPSLLIIFLAKKRVKEITPTVHFVRLRSRGRDEPDFWAY